MKKQLGIMVLTTVVIFGGTTLNAFAGGKTTSPVEDGRQQNGLETGHVLSVNLSEGPYYVGDKISLTAGEVLIDGPLDTLKWFGLGEFLLTEAGTKTFEVSAATYFKNGKKDGLIHSTTETFIVSIDVREKIQEELKVISHSFDEYDYTEAKNPNGKVTGYDFNAVVTFTLSNGETKTTNVFHNNAQEVQIAGNMSVVEYQFTSQNGTVLTGFLNLPSRY